MTRLTRETSESPAFRRNDVPALAPGSGSSARLVEPPQEGLGETARRPRKVTKPQKANLVQFVRSL